MEYRLSPEAARLPRTTAFCVWVGVLFMALVAGAYVSAATRISVFVTTPPIAIALGTWRLRLSRRQHEQACQVSISVDQTALTYRDPHGHVFALPRSHLTRITRDETGRIRIYTNHDRPLFWFEERDFASGAMLVRELNGWQHVQDVPTPGIWVPNATILGGLLAVVFATVVAARHEPIVAIFGLCALVVVALVAAIATKRQRLLPRRYRR